MSRPWTIDGFAAARVAAVLASLLFACASGSSRAEAPIHVTAGFSASGLEHVSEYLRNEVSTGKIPGAVLLIQQHGRPVLFESYGVRDVDSKRPMTADTIFRFYSMSKPITSVAVMMLVDEGKLSLDDPLSKFIPVF